MPRPGSAREKISPQSVAPAKPPLTTPPEPQNDPRGQSAPAQKWSALPITGDAEFPSFSHYSRFVYFLCFGRDQGVFRIPVTEGKEERVADLANWHITGFFGFSMTLDPTDAPLVLRDTGTDDIYALTLEEK